MHKYELRTRPRAGKDATIRCGDYYASRLAPSWTGAPHIAQRILNLPLVSEFPIEVITTPMVIGRPSWQRSDVQIEKKRFVLLKTFSIEQASEPKSTFLPLAGFKVSRSPSSVLINADLKDIIMDFAR